MFFASMPEMDPPGWAIRARKRPGLGGGNVGIREGVSPMVQERDKSSVLLSPIPSPHTGPGIPARKFPGILSTKKGLKFYRGFKDAIIFLVCISKNCMKFLNDNRNFL